MNYCIFSGTIASDLNLVSTAQGTSVLNFSICESRRFKSGGKTKYENVYLKCEAWDSGAETISKYFKRGDVIDIVARAKNKKNKEGWNETVFRVQEFSFPTRPYEPRSRTENDGD